jgi:hypothetical protein
MGLNDPKSSNKLYLNIVGGRIAQRFKEHQFDGDKQLTEEREIINKQTKEVEKVVKERYYESIDGLITNAELDKTGDFGARLVFTILDEGIEYTLQISADSSYGRAVMLRIPNVDPSKPATFNPYNFENKENNKMQTGVTIYQKGCDWEKDKVPYRWTKDNPGSLPSWEEVDKMGKKEWDSTKQLNFLAAHFEQWAKSVGAIVTSTPTDFTEQPQEDPDVLAMEKEFAEDQAKKAEEKTQPSQNVDPNVGEVDDLPF